MQSRPSMVDAETVICQTHLNTASKPGRPRRLRVVLVDDSPLALAALVRLLSSSFPVHVAGQAASGPDGFALVSELEPDLVITDLEMPGFDGFHLVKRVREAFPAIRSIVISTHDGAAWHKLSRLRGADGFVAKERLPEELPCLLAKLFPGAGTAGKKDLEP